MPGTTSLGIRYPLQGEVISAQAYQDMADDVDALMTQLDALRDVAVTHPSASISGGSIATASGADGTVTNFSTTTWDTGGYVDLVTNPDRFTVPSGVYWAVCEGTLSGATTVTAKRLAILHSFAICGAQSVDTLTGTGNGAIGPASGVVICSGATNAVQARAFWTGTGGPATTGNVDFRIYKIRELSDL